jgi:hypothetical protein
MPQPEGVTGSAKLAVLVIILEDPKQRPPKIRRDFRNDLD